MADVINNKRVLKNTAALYIRMGVMMIITLYTSRVVLQNLGVTDFGIYNIVGGVVVMFSFLSITLEVAVRRFLTVELGKGGENYQQVFISSLYAIAIVAVVLVVCVESIGYWLVNYKLTIPSERLIAANWAFQFSILTFLINFLTIPFSASITAHERMDAYAYFGIIDALLRLGIAFLIQIAVWDKLILYAELIAFSAFILSLLNIGFCHWKLGLSFKFKLTDKSYIRSILTFSGWSVMGQVVNLLSTQGINLMFNMFWGVVVNAAMGVSQQASTALSRFIYNFQIAFNPQLTKSYTVSGLSDETFNFMSRISKVVVLLIFVIGYSLLCNIDALLEIWLVEVPEYAQGFCRIAIIVAAIEGCAGPLYILVYAKGDVVKYQISLAIVQILYIAITYILCKMGYSPVVVYSLTVVSYVVAYFVRLYLLRNIMDFPVFKYLKLVFMPLLVPLICLISFQALINLFVNFDSLIWTTIVRVLSEVLFSAAIMYFVYFTKEEKRYALNMIRKKV
jgi:O-antigen/teichoic acid export membrane protein